jgi:hypothetical protein
MPEPDAVARDDVDDRERLAAFGAFHTAWRAALDRGVDPLFNPAVRDAHRAWGAAPEPPEYQQPADDRRPVGDETFNFGLIGFKRSRPARRLDPKGSTGRLPGTSGCMAPGRGRRTPGASRPAAAPTRRRATTAGAARDGPDDPDPEPAAGAVAGGHSRRSPHHAGAIA